MKSLATNPSTEHRQLLSMDSWKLFRIMSEFVEGFETMADLGPSVSVFGSARLPPDNPYYQLAVETTTKIAQIGFSVITGGGPGIMEAANKGARDGGGNSCGLGIDLPFEAIINEYIDPKFNLNFRYFFVRKVMFVRYAQAFIVFPGGFGTLDELFEALTLIQTNKVRTFPIYLMGKEYWKGLIDWIQDRMLTEKCISPEDMDRFVVTDDPDEVVKGIEQHYLSNKSFKNF
jgi:uncharacterized protein (TIGR00730 family)